jgi:hypothetical protein
MCGVTAEAPALIYAVAVVTASWPDLVKLQIAVRSTMNRVPREVGRRRHVELRVAVADVALEEIGPARDVEAELLALVALGAKMRHNLSMNFRRTACDRRANEGNIAFGNHKSVDGRCIGTLTKASPRD